MTTKPGRKSAAELASPKPVAVVTVINRRETPPAPAHIAETTAAWWRAVVSEYELEPHHLRLLQGACEAWDRQQQARAAVDRLGMTFDNKDGEPRVRPEVAIERDSRLAFARLIRELDLDVAPPGEGRSRPPAIGSNRR